MRRITLTPHELGIQESFIDAGRANGFSATLTLHGGSQLREASKTSRRGPCMTTFTKLVAPSPVASSASKWTDLNVNHITPVLTGEEVLGLFP